MQTSANLQELMKALTRAASGELKHPEIPVNRYNVCTDAIMAYILQHDLKPGAPLPRETQLCEMLGVSRSSLREAIRRLETLRIVEPKHGKGTFVGDFSLSPLLQTLTFRSLLTGGEDLTQLRSVVEMRQMLDLGSAEEVVHEFSQLSADEARTVRERLSLTIEQMQSQAGRGETFEDLDLAFHTVIWEQVDNELLGQLSYTLWLVHMAVNSRLHIPVSSKLEQTAASHWALLETACQGDLNGYREAVKQHYACILEAIAA